MGALGLPEDSFDAVLSGVPRDFLKLAHYPGNTDGAPERQGVGPHKDSDILTLLWQDETGGLQVFLEGKGWIDAVPLKNSFIVNVGETLELATDGYLTADIHQVVMDARHTKSRYSIPYFIGPNLDLKEIPILSLPKELKDQARGPATDPMNPLIRNPGINTMKGRLRSHLGTTERFYPGHYKIIKEKGIIASSAY
ncbi:2OG-Fe(II) oxygenase family oxidoreductase [Angomonas deanei]|uniref:2OG-Fe(II) oxygenase superfamily, putative n=1 Tax=Angomonas deanei TaxID=59799 RepID=A0A7G2CRT5_9TRYP|nr:2OG-Fe(II) oxygenase family oxidoreductase [Angomonas deanei]CAD2222079.1 2OG-Fe(II) oxygenase superfamily, putative [Angomonas deanei]|eukprot:EPY20592.1 2OG-Fe(II) oxygenase family oxidoreductase [Angomonas deanei]